MSAALTPKPPPPASRGRRGGGRERYYPVERAQGGRATALQPQPPPDAGAGDGDSRRWGLLAVRSEWMEVTAGPELLAAGDKLLSEALRLRASIAIAEEHEWRTLTRSIDGYAAALRRRSVCDAERLVLVEEDARDDIMEAEEHKRIVIFLRVLQSFEFAAAAAMPKALLATRQHGAAADALAAGEEEARIEVGVDASAAWARLEFQAEHSVAFIERMTPAVRRERDLITEREAACRTAIDAQYDDDLDTMLDELRPEHAEARRKTKMLPTTHHVVQDESKGRRAIKVAWVEELADVSASAVAQRGAWLEALQTEEEHARGSLVDTEHDAVVRLVDMHDYLPRASGVPDDEPDPVTEYDRLRAELFSLEDCYRQIWREKEAAAHGRLLDTEKGERDRTNKLLRDTRVVPACVAEMMYDASLQRQATVTDEAKGWAALVADFHTSTSGIAFRRLTDAHVRPRVHLPAAAVEAIGALRVRVDAFAAEMSAASTAIAKEFETQSAQAVEDVAMKNGLTHGWEVLLNIAWLANLRLQAECKFVLTQLCHTIVVEHVPIDSYLAKEAELARTTALTRIPEHLRDIHRNRCAAADRARDTAYQGFMHLFVAYARAAHRTHHAFAASLRVDLTQWALEARKLSVVQGAAADWVRYGPVRAQHEEDRCDATLAASMAHMEGVMRDCCERWNEGVAEWCRDTVPMEIEWCDQQQRVIASDSCVSVEIARARVDERAAVRSTRAHAAVLLQDARVAKTLVDDEVALSSLAYSAPQVRWLEEGLALVAREYPDDPHLRRVWGEHMQRFQQRGLYLLRRHALLALAASDLWLAGEAEATHRAAHAMHLDAVFDVLDTAGLDDLIERGEEWLALDEGSDDGGRALARLRLVKDALQCRRRIGDDEAASRDALILDILAPAAVPTRAVSEALLGREVAALELTAAYEGDGACTGGGAGDALDASLAGVLYGGDEASAAPEVPPATVGEADVAEVVRSLAVHGVASTTAFVTVRGGCDPRLRGVPIRLREDVAAAAARAAAGFEVSAALCVWVQASRARCSGVYRREADGMLRQADGIHALRRIAGQWEIIEFPYAGGGTQDATPHTVDTAHVDGRPFTRLWLTYNGRAVYAADAAAGGRGVLYCERDGRWAVAEPAAGGGVGRRVARSASDGWEDVDEWLRPPGSGDAEADASECNEAVAVLRAVAHPACGGAGRVGDGGTYPPPAVRAGDVNDGVQVHTATLATNPTLFGAWADPQAPTPAAAGAGAVVRWVEVFLFDFAERCGPWFTTACAGGELQAMDGAGLCRWDTSRAAARDYER